MTWDLVRKTYPNCFVKMKINDANIEDSVRYINDVEVLESFDNNADATKELVRAKDDIIVFHTINEKLEIPIRNIFGFRGVV